MLITLIANLQNIAPGPSPRPPKTVKIDRGGSGPSWPGYDIVDIVHALDSFREVRGEHPVARAARRFHHIGQTLGKAKQERENREAAAFLAGAALAEHVAAERDRARVPDALKVMDLVTIIDEVRGQDIAVPAPRRRGQARGGGGGGLVLGGIALGVLVGVLIAKR